MSKTPRLRASSGLRGGRLKGKGKEVLGARKTPGAQEEGRNSEFGSRKSEVGSRKKISCEQRFLSCMALSAYEVVRAAVTYSILLQ